MVINHCDGNYIQCYFRTEKAERLINLLKNVLQNGMFDLYIAFEGLKLYHFELNNCNSNVNITNMYSDVFINI